MLKEKINQDFTENQTINDLKNILSHHFIKSSTDTSSLVEHTLTKESKLFFDEFENVHVLKYKDNEYELRKRMNGDVYIQNKNDTIDVNLYEVNFILENNKYIIEKVSYGQKNKDIQSMATLYLNNNENSFRYNYYDMIENESVSLMFDKNFELQVENGFEHINIQNPDGEIQKIQQFFEKISAIKDPVLNKEIVKYLTQNSEIDIGYKDVLNIMHDVCLDKQDFLTDYRIDTSNFNIKKEINEIKEPKKLKI